MDVPGIAVRPEGTVPPTEENPALPIQRFYEGVLARRHLVVAALVASTAAVSLLCTHLALVQRDRVQLDQLTQRLLEDADDVALESARTLQATHALTTEPCSEADLAELRFLAFLARNVRDVGRVRAGQLVCSATWGRLDAPKTLPPPDRITPGGHHLWNAVSDVVDPRISAQMAGKGDAVVVTAPDAFRSMEKLHPDTALLLSSRDGSHVFQMFGDTRALEPGIGEAFYEVGTTRRQSRCSSTFDICVAARKAGSGLGDASPWLLLGIGLLGGLAGAGLAALLSHTARNRISIEAQLGRAIRGNGLDVVYQPLRQLDSRVLVGVEVLARWRLRQGQSVPPDVFVPMAERMGLGGALTRQVVRKAFAELAPRLSAGSAIYVSLNLTADDLMDERFHAWLEAQCARHGIAASAVVLEITERSTAAHADLASRMRALRDKGFRFFIDDFGTGYSNLAYLTDLPLDGIKIDKRFTASIGTGSPISQILEPICAMARILRVRVVVEGVETEPQVQHIRQLLPEAIGQGWLLGHPVPGPVLPAR